MKKIFMLLFFLTFSFSLENTMDFKSRDCSEINNPDECFDVGCEWIVIFDQSSGILIEECIDPSDDWEDHEDGPPECLLDCEGIENINPEDDPYEACDWIISIFGFDPGFASCTADCDDETMIEINEIVEACYECLADNNCEDIFDEDDDCNPDLGCGQALTCCDGLLYPTTCCSANCDEPIGECDDYYEGCQSDNGDWYDIGHEMFISDCEYFECTENGWNGPFELNNDECFDDNDWECSDLGYEDCQALDYCEWISDSDNPNSWGSCVEANNNDDGPPECVMDCEGIENINPEDDPYEACDWIISIFGFDPGFASCTADCDDETMMEINEIVEACYECLENEDIDCADIFGDNDSCSDLGYEDCEATDYCEWISDSDNPNSWGSCVEFGNNGDGCFENGEWYCYGCELFINECEYYECTENGWEGPFEMDDCIDNNECSELNYPDCIENEECEWIITNEWGGYSCVEVNENCEDLDYDQCIESNSCQPSYNAAGEFEGCEEINNQPNFGYLYGTVSYIYGDVVDFVPYTQIYIESLPSNTDTFYFETMTNEYGYYEIELPTGAYLVTAYVDEESLTQDILIAANGEHELNFLLGDWGGPWDPDANLSLGSSQAVPGSDVAVPLYLTSPQDVGGVQFTIETNMPGILNLIDIESLDPCFSAYYSVPNEGQLIGIIFSLEGCSYPANQMLQITDLVFNVSDEASFGDEVELFFNNTIVSGPLGNEIPSYGNGGIVIIGAQGDVNADGEFNVLDVVMMVNFALYTEEPSDSEFWASDLNNDGAINVLDIVQMVNLILGD